MAILTVGPTSTFPTIAAAMAAAGPGDIISLEAGYSNETATVLHSGMIIDGGPGSLGIVLVLGSGVATVTLVGTAPIDVRDAGDGNGIVGNDGDNVITVTAGADAVSGGAGHDRLFVDYRLATGAITGDSTSNVAEAGGGARLVTINGGFEDFTIWTGSGADTITTGAGDDDIRTGEGASTVVAGEGANYIVGGSGADTVTAGSGGNFIDGGDGANTITSGGGMDEILSGGGDDTIVAGAGDDSTTVTGGADTVDSGADNDLLIVDYSASTTAVIGGVTGGTLLGGYSGHIADLAGAMVDFVTTERYSITTGSGDDILATGDGDDLFMTGAGDDTIDAAGGIDTLRLSGNRADYDVTDDGEGTYTIVDLRTGSPDDTDIVTGIEFLTFTDGTFAIDAPFNDAPVAVDDSFNAVEDVPVTYAAADLLGNDSDGELDPLVIAGVSNATGGTAVLNANGTVTFTPTANFNGDAGFDYEVSDGNGGTDTGHAAIAVAAVNDAPLNVRPGAQPINEDGAVTFSTGNGNAISVSDVDLGAANLTVTLSIQSGALILSGTAGLVVSGDASNLVTLTGSAAAINTALNGLVYTPPANFNGSRTLTITTDDNGNVGTDPGGDPGSEQDVDTVTITIAAINDAPVVIGDSTEFATTINEDVPGAGQTIQALFAGQYSDAADNQIPNGGASSPGQFSGIAVSANGSSAATGQWQYFSGGVWTDIGAVSDAAAKLLGDPFVTLIRFNPAPDFNGAAPTLTVHLIDNSLGFGIVNGQLVNLSGVGATGGNTAYSTGTVVLGQAVTAVNDAPLNTVPGTQSIAEDGAVTFSTGNANDISVSDVDVGAGNLTVTLTIADGALTLSGTAGLVVNGNASNLVTLTGSGAAINTALNGLVYAPPADSSGSRTLTITTNDNGNNGTDPGGDPGSEQDVDTVTINVGAVNDAPVLSSPTDADIGYTENETSVALMQGVILSDPDLPANLAGGSLSLAVSGSDGGIQLRAGSSFVVVNNGDGTFGLALQDGPTQVAIGTITGFGTPTLQVAALTAEATLPRLNDLIDDFTFVIVGDNPTAGDRTVTLTVDDGNNVGASLAAGLTHSVTQTLSIAVTDDMSVVDDDAAVTDEASPVTIDVLANDEDVDGPLPAVVSVNGAALVVGTAFALPSGALLTLNADGTLTYDPHHVFDSTPTSESGALNTPASDGFSYTLTDGATANVSLTIAGVDSHDLLLGLGRDVAMAGGIGNDTYVIDSASDVAYELAGEGIDAIYTSFSYTLSNVYEIETLATLDWLATTAINLTGNALNNYMIGNAGANVLDGGAGLDFMQGREGNDIYIVDNAGDIAYELASQGSDAVYTSVSYSLNDAYEVETLSTLDWAAVTAINLTGNSGANYIIGNAGANVLDGGAGADFLQGREGNDIYIVDNAGDIAYELASEGSDEIYTSVSYSLNDAYEVETLSTLDWAAVTAINLTGNSGANYIIGNAGANVLDGKGGNDILQGKGGADTFQFTSTLGVGNVDQILDMVAGTDKIALDDTVFTGLTPGALPAGAFVTGSAAADADDRIIYNSTTGQLFFDADGSGAGAAVLFATVTAETVLAASDFTVI